MTITSASLHFSQAYQHGQQDAQQLMHQPATPTWLGLPLARFNNAGMRGMVMRRMLLTLGQPGQVLVHTASVLMRRHLVWQQFAWNYFYWRGARHTCDPETWKRLTHGPLILMYHAVGRAGE